MSVSNYLETKVMDALFNNVSPAAIQLANRYLKLHTGDPGEDGTANAATETTRKSVTSAASANGVFTSTNDLTWTNVAASETYSHASVWDAAGPAGGNCLWTGALTASKAVNAGDTFTISAGSLTVTLD
jgi:hypothetical protein